jgi:hypothetical protein
MKVDHKKDKEYLLGLIESLSISKRNLKRDELGYWNLVGKRAFIDTDGEFWYVRYVRDREEPKRRWQKVKTSLQFMGLWQDGDDEGAFRLHRYPSPEEAQKIRKIVGFTTTKKLSDEDKEKLKIRLSKKLG